MFPNRALIALAAQRERLCERIRGRRRELTAAAARGVVPLHWLDLGLRVRRLVRHLARR